MSAMHHVDGHPNAEAGDCPDDVPERSQAELLIDLAEAADLRRAHEHATSYGDLVDVERRITALEAALIIELRSRRGPH